MRGKPEGEMFDAAIVRITPADAGKTRLRRRILKPFGDHPRGCGENINDCCARTIREGSPPRMRGKLQYNLYHGRHKRITPADAGKTFAPCAGVSVQNGSPPRMRGKLRTIA